MLALTDPDALDNTHTRLFTEFTISRMVCIGIYTYVYDTMYWKLLYEICIATYNNMLSHHICVDSSTNTPLLFDHNHGMSGPVCVRTIVNRTFPSCITRISLIM
jgi:hypothetical protein